MDVNYIHIFRLTILDPGQSRDYGYGISNQRIWPALAKYPLGGGLGETLDQVVTYLSELT